MNVSILCYNVVVVVEKS